MPNNKSILSFRDNIITFVIAAITALSILSFLKRNDMVTFGVYMQDIVEFFHIITFDITKLVIENIPYFNLHVTGFNSDILWIFFELMLPPAIIVFLDKDTGFFMRALYILAVFMIGHVFLDLFDKNQAITFAENHSLREQTWNTFIKGIAINQVALMSYACGLIGKDVQIKAIKIYIGIALALSLVFLLYLAGLISIM